MRSFKSLDPRHGRGALSREGRVPSAGAACRCFAISPRAPGDGLVDESSFSRFSTLLRCAGDPRIMGSCRIIRAVIPRGAVE